jgi:hypothetical protein
MREPLTNGHMLYARYAFSYVSTLPEAQGRRVGFEGVSIMKLRARLAPERVCKILAREGKRLREAPEMARHRLADQPQLKGA